MDRSVRGCGGVGVGGVFFNPVALKPKLPKALRVLHPFHMSCTESVKIVRWCIQFFFKSNSVPTQKPCSTMSRSEVVGFFFSHPSPEVINLPEPQSTAPLCLCHLVLLWPKSFEDVVFLRSSVWTAFCVLPTPVCETSAGSYRSSAPTLFRVTSKKNKRTLKHSCVAAAAASTGHCAKIPINHGWPYLQNHHI